MRTRAVRDGDDYVLDGTKAWISQAGVSTHYTVMAVTEPGVGARGISAFVVHADDPGFSVGTPEHKMGIKGSPTCEVHFEGCRIPADRMIGAPGTGFKTALATLDHTRLTIAAQAVGIAQGSLDASIAYTKERQPVRQAGVGLPGRAVHARRHGHEDRGLPPAGLRRGREGRPRRGRPHLRLGRGQVLRLRHGDAGRRPTPCSCSAATATRQDFPVERYMRDAKITQIYEGTNQIQRVVMARSLLR